MRRRWAEIALFYFESLGPWVLFALGVYAVVYCLTELFLA